MITRKTNTTQNFTPPNWQIALKNAYKDPIRLLQDLGLTAEQAGYSPDALLNFPLRVPQSFVARMQKNNPNDPLLKQVLPSKTELIAHPGYSQDPLDESNHNPIPGLLHKYHGRALLTIAGACAINCRYCFRRHFPYHENNPAKNNWQAALNYIAADTTIHEIILSGGDPLLATDASLQPLLSALTEIEHIKFLRIHSRIPIVLPERLTNDLLALLTQTKLPCTLVVHCNHPQEINQEVINALMPYRQAGIILLNQAVLLRGINDDITTQCQLSSQLITAGIVPYYLHLLDPVAGAAHFNVPREEAIPLMEQMRNQLPGYFIPKLVQEIPGTQAKQPVG